MDGESKLETYAETLSNLTADPELAATIEFPTTGIAVTLHSAGDGEWHMICRSEKRGVFSVDRLPEERMLWRLGAVDAMEKLAQDLLSRSQGPKLVSDVEAYLQSQQG